MSTANLALALAVLSAVVSFDARAESVPIRAPQPHALRSQPSIVALAVDDFTRPYLRLINDQLRDVMLAAPRAPALFFESLDASRFGDGSHLDEVRAYFERKYSTRSIDLVIALGEDALEFLARDRSRPWPGASVLYLEAGSVRVDTRQALPQSRGILLEDHFSSALAVVKAILPNTAHVALVYGAAPIDQARWGGFADKVRTAGLGLQPIVLAGLSM